MSYVPEFERWCRNCGRSIFFHGDSRTKCLFEPTTFEPMRDWDEYVKQQAKIVQHASTHSAYLEALGYEPGAGGFKRYL